MEYCFLIPVHEPKYYYVYKFLQNLEFIPFDIFLVFTDQDEYNSFNKNYISDKIKPIIFDQLYDMHKYIDHFERSNSWINVKTYWIKAFI